MDIVKRDIPRAIETAGDREQNSERRNFAVSQREQSLFSAITDFLQA